VAPKNIRAGTQRPDVLVLAREVYDAVLDHALAGTPEEVCGILAGERGEGTSHADLARRTENAAVNPRTTYRIDPETQLEAMDAVEAEGHDVVGFYHSHPAGPAGPSRTDAARASWPGYSYLIVVLGEDRPSVGSWRWTGETFERESVAVRSLPPAGDGSY